MLKFNVCGERHRAFAETVHLVIRTVNWLSTGHHSENNIIGARDSYIKLKTKGTPGICFLDVV